MVPPKPASDEKEISLKLQDLALDEKEIRPNFQDPGSDEEEIRSGFRKAALDKYKKDGDIFWLSASAKEREAMSMGFKDISWPVLEYEPLFPAETAFVMPDKYVCCIYGSKRNVFSVNHAKEQAKSKKGPKFAQLLVRETGVCKNSKCNGHVCGTCRIVSKSGITLGRIQTGVADKARWQPVGWQCAKCKKEYFVQAMSTTSTVELDDKLQMVPVYRYINYKCTTRGCVGEDKKKPHFNTRCEILNPYNNSLGKFPRLGKYRPPADAPNEAPVYLQSRWLWEQIIIPAQLP
ncbi:hypothetical protein QBC43DRAFT_311313 [Cladorrhinum sp. PSN259]|nr:hypothetical protein QBC43DRAFT_311313 [Cladorrhinum sp. PSN259]